MNFFVGITDKDWFDFVSQRRPDEVNFWRPGSQTFSTLEQGEPFLFKLHSPLNYIVGGGFFFMFIKLPLSMAWKCFEEKNGVASYIDLSRKIRSYHDYDRRKDPDPTIGSIILTQPFFLEEADWIEAPIDWSSNIVSGKRYNDQGAIGREIWRRVEQLLKANILGAKSSQTISIDEHAPQYGTPYWTQSRIGQGGFRAMVIEAYGRRCSVTGEKTVPVLEAAHIKPYAESGPHSLQNGILLRSDLHTLLDEGYLTVSKDYRVEISRKLKEDYENGRDYYKYHGNSLLILPRDAQESPGGEYLQWHRENVYRG